MLHIGSRTIFVDLYIDLRYVPCDLLTYSIDRYKVIFVWIPRNLREFDSCKRNARILISIEGSVVAKIVSGHTVYCRLLVLRLRL